MSHITTLTHITDVGTPQGDGVDSTERINKQYKRLGVDQPRVISAGCSPLHVAFAACADVSLGARNRVAKLLEQLEIVPQKPLPTALNCAPRNSKESRPHAQEDHIYRVRSSKNGDETFLIYGLDVLKWVLCFRGRVGQTVEKIFEISGLIPDTSNGSQFRSAEHLPIVHFLEAVGRLDDISGKQKVDMDSIDDVSPRNNGSGSSEAIFAPPDEYGNCRVIVRAEHVPRLLKAGEAHIDSFTGYLPVRASLTEVVQGELSIWPSSNHFPNNSLAVLNIGKRWEEGTTRTTDPEAIELAEEISERVGERQLFG